MKVASIDIAIIVVYGAIIIFIGLFVSRTKKGKKKDAGDYFLAGRGLSWWAIELQLLRQTFPQSNLLECQVQDMQLAWQWQLTSGLRLWD